MRALAILLAGALGSCTCGTLSPDQLAERYPYAQGRLFSRGGLAPVLAELEAKITLRIDVKGPRERGNVTFDATGALVGKHVD